MFLTENEFCRSSFLLVLDAPEANADWKVKRCWNGETQGAGPGTLIAHASNVNWIICAKLHILPANAIA